MAELAELDVDRVDAVDDPANQTPFLILKAEESDELRANVTQLINRLQALLAPLAKRELDPDVAEALTGIARAAGLSYTFRAKKPADNQPAEEYGYPPPEKRPARKDQAASLDVDALSDAIAKALAPHLAPLAELAKALQPTTPPPASRQPAGEESIAKSRPKRLGEGLFADVVFGRR